MNEPTQADLYARVEVIAERLDNHIDQSKRDRDETLRKIEESEKISNEIITALNKQRGFIGGVTLAVSSVWAVVLAFKTTIFKFFTGS